jgi:hypothetical protein
MGGPQEIKSDILCVQGTENYTVTKKPSQICIYKIQKCKN